MTAFRRSITSLALAGVAALHLGCGSPTESRGTPALLVLEGSSHVLLDDTLHLRALVMDNRGRSIESADVDWVSSSTAVATVDVQGILSADALGTSEIVARHGELEDRLTVTVVPHYTQVSLGDIHTCAINGLGRSKCWGADGFGQLGDGLTAGCAIGIPCDPLPTAVLGDDVAFTSIAAGGQHSCGLNAAGRAYCWGANHSGQLGTGTNEHRMVATPVATDVRFSSLALGYYHSCGIATTGTVYCWGEDHVGQLGLGSPAPEACATLHGDPVSCSRTPRTIASTRAFTSIVAGNSGTCGLSDGRMVCWGQGVGGTESEWCQGGEQGNCAYTPIQIGDREYAELGMGWSVVCGRIPSGAVYCFGADFFGQFGNDNEPVIEETPILAAGGATYTDLAVGAAHTCALRPDGVAECWGQDSDFQLGDQAATERRAVPMPVDGDLRFTSIHSTGQSRHTCAIAQTGRLYCWGTGFAGGIGDGGMQERPMPTLVRFAR